MGGDVVWHRRVAARARSGQALGEAKSPLHPSRTGEVAADAGAGFSRLQGVRPSARFGGCVKTFFRNQ